MPYVMLSARSLNVKLNALIKDVKCLIVLSVLQFVNNHIVLLTAKHLSLNVNQYARNLNAIGNVISQLVLNPNASLFVKIQTVYQRLNAVTVLWEHLEYPHLCLSSKKLKRIQDVADVQINHLYNIII
jgi:hypothetical protein